MGGLSRCTIGRWVAQSQRASQRSRGPWVLVADRPPRPASAQTSCCRYGSQNRRQHGRVRGWPVGSRQESEGVDGVSGATGPLAATGGQAGRWAWLGGLRAPIANAGHPMIWPIVRRCPGQSSDGRADRPGRCSVEPVERDVAAGHPRRTLACVSLSTSTLPPCRPLP